MRQDVALSPMKICNRLKNTILLISQDPEKLKHKIAELSLEYKEEKEFSWCKPFTLEKKIYAVVYYLKTKMYSQVFLVEGDKQSKNYNIQLGSDFKYVMGLDAS